MVYFSPHIISDRIDRFDDDFLLIVVNVAGWTRGHLAFVNANAPRNFLRRDGNRVYLDNTLYTGYIETFVR